MKLIVDSGSTKTSWRLQLESGIPFPIETIGVNPVRDDAEAVHQVIITAARSFERELPLFQHQDFTASSVSEVYFYGAGCVQPYSEVVRESLSEGFPRAKLFVESDLLGAARALCGHSEGIACIMGTGSNSCLYDGEKIVKNVSPLGWILGDEGSGAVLGRLFVGAVLKQQFHKSLCTSFLKYHNLTQADIIARVYRQPLPNRFLASLVPYISRVQGDREVRPFLLREFRRFFKRNVLAYRRPDLPVNFVGGVAAAFEDLVREAAEKEKLTFGFIEKSPIDKIYQYHCG